MDIDASIADYFHKLGWGLIFDRSCSISGFSKCKNRYIVKVHPLESMFEFSVPIIDLKGRASPLVMDTLLEYVNDLNQNIRMGRLYVTEKFEIYFQCEVFKLQMTFALFELILGVIVHYVEAIGCELESLTPVLKC